MGNANSARNLKNLLNERLKGIAQTPKFTRPMEAGALPDFNDEASAEQERFFVTRLADRRRKEALRLQSALNRLEGGRYGVCEACDEPIDARRLAVNPTAIYCLACQAELETPPTPTVARKRSDA